MNLVEPFVQISPDAPAIMGPRDQVLNYLQLSRTVSALTEFLSSREIKLNQRIAVVNPNGFEMAISFLAISNVASFVPLSPDYSLEQYRYYFEILKTDTLVLPPDYNSALLRIAEEMNMTIYFLQKQINNDETIYQFIGGVEQESSYSVNLATNDDIAMVNYTSGTTSKPKIVPRTHINVCSGIAKRIADYSLTANDRALIISPIFRSIGLNSILTALCSGGCAICADGFEPGEFFRIIKEASPTYFFASPIVFQTIVEYAEKNNIKDINPSLRFIRSGGAPLPEILAQKSKNIFNVPIYATYGLTETGGISTTAYEPKGHKVGSVGVPTFVDINIMDENGQFLGKNNTGEIVVRGPQVIKGYDDDVNINSESFYGDWFRTGDKGFLDDDEYLFITGRFKEIINRGGEKISPYEVEEAINNHPNVLQNVAFPIPGMGGNEDVGAVVVLKAGKSLNLKELRRFLNGKIVAFKMPTSLYVMKEIPASDVGKIQRKILFDELNALGINPQPESGENEEIVLPHNEIESKLHKIFQSILPVKEISVTDTFFELGGDSLRAAVLYDQIKINFKIQIPLTYIFKNGSIEALAEFILNNNKKKTLNPFVVPFQEEGSKNPIFFVHAAEGESVIYHNIAKKFDPERPFYGIDFNPDAVKWEHPVTFEQIVEHYIKDIRSIQTQGPYILAGHCVGGIIAYEMARQLHEVKQEIGLLAMYDSVIPGTEETLKVNQRFKRNLAEIKKYSLKEITKFLSIKKFYYRIRFYKYLYKKSPYFLKPLVFRFMDKNSAIKYARSAYEIKKYDGEIIFFKPDNNLIKKKTNNSIDIWSKFARNVRIISLKGNHNSVFYEENAENTKAVLLDILENIP